jgi:hypothetical protein
MGGGGGSLQTEEVRKRQQAPIRIFAGILNFGFIMLVFKVFTNILSFLAVGIYHCSTHPGSVFYINISQVKKSSQVQTKEKPFIFLYCDTYKSEYHKDDIEVRS